MDLEGRPIATWAHAHRAGVLLGCAAAGIGAAALAGWVFDIDLLKRLVPGLVQMTASTALMLLAGGVALARIAGGKGAPGTPGGKLTDLPASFMLALALLILAEHLAGASLGIDELLFRDPETHGRPPLIIAVLAALLGAALLLVRSGGRAAALGQVIAFGAWAVALLALLTYLFNFHALYAVPAFHNIALHSALGLFLLASGVLCARPDCMPARVYFLATPSGAQARRLLLAVLLLLPLLAALRIAGQRAGFYGTEFGIALLTSSAIAALVVVIGLVAYGGARAESTLARINRMYVALSETNQAIVHARERDVMLARVCAAAVDKAGFYAAWIGVVEASAAATAGEPSNAGTTNDGTANDGTAAGAAAPLRVVASAGGPPGFTDAAVRAAGKSPVLRGWLDGSLDAAVLVINDIAALPPGEVRDRLLPMGVASSVAMPLTIDGRAAGVFCIYSREQGFFAHTERDLLEEMAGDLGFGLTRLREQERLRHALEEIVALKDGLEETVAQRTAELRLVNEDLKAFNDSASHDLRGPLRSVRGFLGLALAEAGESIDAEVRALLDRAMGGVARMDQLLDDMLRLATAREAPFNPVDVDLSEMAAAVAGELRQGAPQAPHQVAIEPGLHVNGDPALLRMVLTNLLGNAWKYSSHAGAPRVEFGRAPEAGGSSGPAYCVRDNGAGFDMRYADKLFQPFRRMHNQSEFPGTGLGLTIVRRIVERHGGRIWAEAEVGAGARFYFTLG